MLWRLITNACHEVLTTPMYGEAAGCTSRLAVSCGPFVIADLGAVFGPRLLVGPLQLHAKPPRGPSLQPPGERLEQTRALALPQGTPPLPNHHPPPPINKKPLMTRNKKFILREPS